MPPTGWKQVEYRWHGAGLVRAVRGLPRVGGTETLPARCLPLSGLKNCPGFSTHPTSSRPASSPTFKEGDRPSCPAWYRCISHHSVTRWPGAGRVWSMSGVGEGWHACMCVAAGPRGVSFCICLCSASASAPSPLAAHPPLRLRISLFVCPGPSFCPSLTPHLGLCLGPWAA